MNRRWSNIAMIAFAILFVTGTARGETVWLDSLDLSAATNGWDTAKRNLSVGGRPIRTRSPDHDWNYPLACRRRPSTITPEPSGSAPLNFPRLVQPVLDRHCIRCHGEGEDVPDLRAGDPLMHRSRWTVSYANLQPYAFFYNDQVFTEPRTVPGKFGARASELLKLLDKGHYDVKLSKEELRRLIVWLDANSDFFGGYEDIEAQAQGEIVEPSME